MASMQVLLDSEVPLRFTGWEVGDAAWLDREDLRRLGDSGSEGGRFINEHCTRWLGARAGRMGAEGFNPWDSLAVVAVSHGASALVGYRCTAMIGVNMLIFY